MLFLATGAWAASDSKLAKDDETFLKEAAQGGQMEVQLGDIAAKKAVHDQVKAFGRRMKDDHSKVNKELMSLAKKKNVELPKNLEGKYKDEVERLTKLSGEEFDREYMQAMVKDHEEDIKAFDNAAKNAKDPDVKSFASKHLPTLKQHLELAQKTSKAVTKVSAKSK
jgi:putative membrane protein